MYLVVINITPTTRIWFDLLRDVDGVYGIGLKKSGGINLDGLFDVPRFIVRPDALYSVDKFPVPEVAFEPITLDPKFRNTIERRLLVHLRDLMIMQSGVSAATRKGVRNRTSINAAAKTKVPSLLETEVKALRCLNDLLRQLFEEAIPARLLNITRQYPLESRGDIYIAGAASVRAMQLAEVFPVLARVIYVQPGDAMITEEQANRCKVLVDEGAPLREIADVAGIDMAFRKIHPANSAIGARITHLLSDCLDIVHAYTPQSVSKQRTWLRMIDSASHCGGEEYIRWIARHCFELGDDEEQIEPEVLQIGDWVRASNYQCEANVRTIHRPFNPRMSATTVQRLNDEWHQEVWTREGFDSADLEFPEPWIDGGEFGKFSIVPLRSPAELAEEGRKLRHCVGSYAHQVAAGQGFIYSVRKGKSYLATVALRRERGRILIGECSGLQNSPPSDEVKKAVDQWLETSKDTEPHLPELLDLEDNPNPVRQLGRDEIPF